MSFKPTVPNLLEAKAILAKGKHPYYHPCSKCGKACSAPTKVFWQKRVKEMGSVDDVYLSFQCRDCRKSKKEIRKERASALYNPEPVTVSGGRKPGDYVLIPERCLGVSVWEEGKFLGTTFHKIFQ